MMTMTDSENYNYYKLVKYIIIYTTSFAEVSSQHFRRKRNIFKLPTSQLT